MTFVQALFQNPLLIYALVAGFLAAVVSGIIGSYVVVKRIVLISGSISHAILGGLGVGVWMERVQGSTWMTPLYGALIAAVIAAVILGWIRLYFREREDTIISALWSIGMAIGVLFISQTPGFNVELTNFLIGNILWVSPQDLLLLTILDIFIVFSVALFHKKFLALSFDEDQARLQGIHVNALYIFLLILTSISIVLLIQVVGIILVMTLLTIPAAIANILTSRLSQMMLFAVLLSMTFTSSGLALSFYADWPSGATIALVAGVAYIFSLLFLKKG